MNVIEALVVTLGLDSTEFDKNERHVNVTINQFINNVTKQTKIFESTGKKVAEVFTNLKTEILGATAAFLGFEGFKRFVTGTVEGQAALGRFALNTRTSAATLRAWGTVAQEVGAHAEDAYGVFDRINQQLAQASVTGTSPLLVMMRRLGIEGLTNQSSLEDVLLKFSARLHELPRNQAQYAANEAGMGAIFNELMLGPEELKKRLAEVYRLMPSVFNQSTEQAMALQKQMALLQLQFEGVKLELWTEVAPAFQAFFELLMKGIKRVDWNAIAAWIGNLIPSIGRLIGMVEGLNTASNGWLRSIGLLTTAWVAFSAVMAASPVGMVLLLAGALVALYNDYETWKKGGKSLINWARWRTEITMAKAAIQGLTTALDALGTAVQKSSNWVLDKAGGFAARRAAEIASQKTAEDQREFGSPMYKTYVTIARAAGFNPTTGEKIHIDYENPDGSAGAPAPATQRAWDDAVDAARGASGASPAPSALVEDAEDPARSPGDGLSVPKATSSDSGYTPTGSAAGPRLSDEGKVSDTFMDRVRAVESGGNDRAVSAKGALGPYQLMPATGATYGLKTPEDFFDPVRERAAARTEIQRLLGVFHGNLRRAMAAYNWGQKNVETYGMGALPRETREYLRRLGLSQGTTSTSYDRSQTQVGPIVIQVPPGANANEIARNIQAELRKVNLPAAVNTGGE